MTVEYVTKNEMIKQFGANYFGLTLYIRKDVSKVYVRSDLPKPVKQSVIAHEQYHFENGIDSSEFGAAIEGFKASRVGFFLSIILSLTPSRLKLYPKLTSIVVLFITFSLIIYFNSFS